VHFLTIYIRKTNPVQDWYPGKKLIQLLQRVSASIPQPELDEPQTMPDRRKAATKCDRLQEYGIHMLVDEMDDLANKAYAAYPARLYLVGLDGRVVYAGGMGPWDFYPDKLGEAIKAYVKIA
jgi:hypothetical protein